MFYLLSLGKLLQISLLPVDRKYPKGWTRDNCMIFFYLIDIKYNCPWINAIFLQDKLKKNVLVTLMQCFNKWQKMCISLLYLLSTFCTKNIYFFLSCTCSIWAGKLHWLDKFLLYIYCHWPNHSFFWYPCHMLPVELWETSCKSSSLLVDKISIGAIKG